MFSFYLIVAVAACYWLFEIVKLLIETSPRFARLFDYFFD